MIAKDFVPTPGIRSFAIMKYLVGCRDRRSHPHPQAHSSRISGGPPWADRCPPLPGLAVRSSPAPPP